MKAILTRANPDGTFDEAGMSNRVVVGFRTWRGLLRHAEAYAHTTHVRVRIEIFGDSIFGEPHETLYTATLS